MAADARRWLLLIYAVPRNPSASRVYVWRKLKRLGAIMLQDAVWVLPATPRAREQFQWLATEIEELRGHAMLWEAHLLLARQEQDLVRQWEAQLAATYQKILQALRRQSPDRATLARQFQQAQGQDYFHSALGQKVRAALRAARGDVS